MTFTSLRCTAIGILVATTMTTSAVAQPKLEEGSWEAVFLTLVNKGNPLGKKDRLAAATALFAYCNRFSRQIPRLSPRESDWLEGEMNARAGTAIKSPEFARKWASEYADQCAFAVGGIRSARTPQDEALHWGIAARVMAERDFYIHMLNLRRVAAIKISQKDLDDLESSPSITTEIINGVILPYIVLGAEWGKRD